MKRRILFNISHGFQARMLLRTQIAATLIDAGCELLVVSPNADEPYFKAEFDRPGYTLVPMPERESYLESLVIKWRQYLLMNPSLGKTLHYKRQKFVEKFPRASLLVRGLNLFLGNIPLLRSLYLKLEAAVYNGSEFDDLLKEYQPHLVVAGTPGFNRYDIHLLRAARRVKLATATVMLSWDNLTSKGYMGAQPDQLLVWSPLMKEEALTYHGFKGPITEVGAAQFDIYQSRDRLSGGLAFREKHGIPAKSKLLVFGTMNQDVYPGQLDDLKAFIKMINSESWAENVMLWVRLHPQTITGRNAYLQERYRELAGDRVHIEIPKVQSERLAWDLPKDDQQHLAGLLQAAHMVIVPRSTLSIDASCAGTPVINMAIDPTFSKGFNYTHYEKILTQKGIWVVRSFDELREACQAYLNEPDLHREGRNNIIRQQLGTYFGNAGKRTAEVLMELANPSADQKNTKGASPPCRQESNWKKNIQT